MVRALPISVPILSCLLLALLGTGCGVKRKLEEETAQVRAAAAEKKAVLRKSEAESAALGNLGIYNNPKQEHLTELKDRIESFKRDGAKLVADREAKAASLKQLEEEFNTYQTKYPPN